MSNGWEIGVATKRVGEYVEVCFVAGGADGRPLAEVMIREGAPLLSGQRLTFERITDIKAAEKVAIAFAIFLETLVEAVGPKDQDAPLTP